MNSFEYDIVAIGGGTGGLVSAAGAQYLGAQAGLVEREALGGDCLWTGCVPSKALIASAKAAHSMRQAAGLGLVPAEVEHSFGSVMSRMRAARAKVAHHDDPERFRAMGVGVHLGEARFLSSREVDVAGVGRIKARRFVIATGASPWAPPIPGLAEVGFLNHHTAFEQDSLAESVAIVGGGPIGLEFAQIYARLGAQVTVVDLQDRILPREDDDVAQALNASLEAEGIRFRLGFRTSRVSSRDGFKVIHGEDGTEIESGEILVATGRRPMVDGLDLDRAGVEVEGLGIKVDRHLRTTAKNIYACGDVTGGLQFTHVADHMAKTVLRNALLPGGKAIDYSVVPRVTYTDPEVAHVGLSEEAAQAAGAKTYRYDLGQLDRAICDGTDEGFVKVHADRKGNVLGATILGHGAGEMLMPFVMAMKHGLSLAAIADTIFPYPTMAEGALRASQEFRRGQLDGTAGRLLRSVVRLWA